jgi:hypothetical protein
MLLSDDIFDKKCELMPSIDQSNFYIEARYFFQKKVVSVLKENYLFTMVSSALVEFHSLLKTVCIAFNWR